MIDAESEDVMEENLDEIDEKGIMRHGFGSTFPVSVLLTPSLTFTLDLA